MQYLQFYHKYGRELCIVKSDTSAIFLWAFSITIKELLRSCGANLSWFHHERNHAVVEDCQPKYRPIGIFHYFYVEYFIY